MESRLPGFAGEFLWELDIARMQLLALATSIPAERYAWSPAGGTRALAAVLVHIAAGNFLLLHMAGAPATDLYGNAAADGLAQIAGMIRKNLELERNLTGKAEVIDFLTRSFESVRQCFLNAAPADLDRAGSFFGEQTTVRRVYLRMLAHSHEHMGQTIAYSRMMGIPMPWPDPLKTFEGAISDTPGPLAAP